ncbi:hypothetical protein ABKW28_13025 [Nocardioides sp. 31GB23]|uniref:hypothetical protein n=1 Tax=Nocardioides sp. 31GB23 TaxID=3156065 RepID=UPI0032B0000B
MKIKLVIGALGAAIVALVTVAAILLNGGSGIDLSDDPRGREACDQLVQSIEYDGDMEVRMGSLLAAGEAAAKSRSEEIRAAAEPLADGVEELEGFALVDEDALRAACEDAGVEVPE